VDVKLVRWPAEADQRARLAESYVPRLLLLEDGIAAPEVLDCLEDWIRLPATDADVRARIRGLLLRGQSHLRIVPELDGHGVLRFGTKWVSLPPVEARLADALVVRFGAVVGRDTLRRSVWPGSSPGRNVLDVHVLRLRRRVAPLGLAIRTVRSRGYMLEAAEVAAEIPAAASDVNADIDVDRDLEHLDGEVPVPAR
jgi:DNA-binding winged helix-turn-helix (wHTH) protein